MLACTIAAQEGVTLFMAITMLRYMEVFLQNILVQAVTLINFGLMGEFIHPELNIMWRRCHRYGGDFVDLWSMVHCTHYKDGRGYYAN